MADNTYRWKGAIEPKHDETAGTSNQTYAWKGAIEPTGAAAAHPDELLVYYEPNTLLRM
jgi:uncharacterized protein involved in tolerance to divalent cations